MPMFDDIELTRGIKDLKKFLKKVKPTYHYVRGWEDGRCYLLEVLDELERRSKYMDYLQTKYAEDKLRSEVLKNALAPRRRDADGPEIRAAALLPPWPPAALREACPGWRSCATCVRRDYCRIRGPPADS